jgi:radical SAM protein with 4Fe4S-binding SPASM domain
MHRALQFLVESGGNTYQCTAGDSLITIMPDGEVFPCRRMPIGVGNVRTAALRDIYYSSGLLRELRDREKTSAGCEGCEHARRCRGGLKCLSYATTGDPFQRDPGCWLPDDGNRDKPTVSRAATCFDEGRV